MYRINMKQVKTAWKRSSSNTSLKDWVKYEGGNHIKNMEVNLMEKNLKAYDAMSDSEGGVYTEKVVKLLLSSS